MNDRVQIQNSKLVRDLHSKAILNTDKVGLEDYMMKRELAKKQQTEQFETKERLAKLENDMSEIKCLLQDIANMRKCK